MDRKYNVRLDLQFRRNNSVMEFDEFDKNTSDFFIRVTKGNKLIDISKAIVTLVAIKPDNSVDAQFVEIRDNNVYCDLKPSMKDITGKYEAIASITVNGETVNTDVISYEVTENKFLRQLNNEVVAEERFTILTDMINRLSTIELQENSRIDAETGRVEAEKQREIVKEKLISDMKKLVVDTNKKIDDYKLEKDTAINLDLQQYKTDTTQDIDNYKNLKDAEIDEQMNRLDANEDIRINQEKARIKSEDARVVSEKNRVEEFEVIKEDYNTYKNVMISESNVATLQNQINNNSTQIKDIAHNTNSNTVKNTSAIATFIWDDCWLEDYTIIYPYMKSKGIKGCSACISTYIDKNPQYMTLAQILEMQGYGWEFMVHTRTHGDLATFDYETQYREIVGCKNELLNKGVNVESIVYPLNSYNDTTLEITRKSLRAGFAYPNVNGDKINKMPINQFAIYRIATEEPLSTNKKYIDEAISKNAWIVFMGHGHYYRNDLFPDDSKWPGKFDQNLQNVKDNIEYCISNGITVKTAKEALNLFENKINLGDTAKGRFLVGADGSVDFDTSTISNIVYNDAGLDGITNETPASSFEKNKITITSVLGKDSGNFPIKNGATLITYNFNPSNLLNNEMAYQV